ncbi:unnamed protein product, partial [marine sediment metagenome]
NLNILSQSDDKINGIKPQDKLWTLFSKASLDELDYTFSSAVAEREGGLIFHFEAIPYSNQSIKLAYYYGRKIFLKDTVAIGTSGKASYKGSIHEGIYLFVFPDSSVYEIMVASEKEYLIKISQAEQKIRYSIQGDSIAEAYDSYQNKTNVLLDRIDSLKYGISTAESHEAQLALKQGMKNDLKEIDRIRNDYVHKYQNTLLGNYLLAQIPISIPEFVIPESIAYPDSLKWVMRLDYYQTHYLDNIAWEDPRLIHTPVLEEKINTYLDKVVGQEPDRLSKAIDLVLNKSTNSD